MEQRTIQFPRGRLTCTVRGGLAELYLEVRPDRPGLYRGLLKGPRGQVDLGLLLPEGGCLRLGRTVPVADLERKGCWPVTGAEAVLAHAFRQGGPSLPGWQRVRDPAARFPGDPVLARAASEEDRWFLCPKEEDGFLLAAPWDPRRSFPLVPAFCLARVREMAGRRWVVFRFSPEGRPMAEGP